MRTSCRAEMCLGLCPQGTDGVLRESVLATRVMKAERPVKAIGGRSEK